MSRIPYAAMFAVLVAAPACSRTKAVIPAPPAKAQRSSTSSLTVVTYNVLADRVRLEERLPALLKVLREAEADVIALQEADDWLLAALEEQPWLKERYEGTRTNGRLDAPGGQLILSRFPIERWRFFDLPSAQGRTAVFAELTVNGARLTIATMHLESPLDAGSMRAKQLDAIVERLGAGEALLLGDFNFSDGASPESDHLPIGFIDCWKSVRPTDPGLTWDVERNPAAKQGSFPGEKSGRIDRILVRSKRWRPRTVSLLADQPIATAKGMFPSDHFGVRVGLQLVGENESATMFP